MSSIKRWNKEKARRILKWRADNYAINGVCALCNEGFEKESAVKVRMKGLKTQTRVSEERDFADLQRYVLSISAGDTM